MDAVQDLEAKRDVLREKIDKASANRQKVRALKNELVDIQARLIKARAAS